MPDRDAGMARLIAFHLFQHRPAFFIARRQPLEMSFEMALDLALGFSQKTQIPFVAEQAGGRAQGKRARVPYWVKRAQAPAEFVDALCGPCQMIRLLGRGLFECRTRFGIARSQRLALIKRLGADLAAVVDTHQRRGQLSFPRREIDVGHIAIRMRPRAVRRCEHRAQSVVEGDDQAIQVKHGWRSEELLILAACRT